MTRGFVLSLIQIPEWRANRRYFAGNVRRFSRHVDGVPFLRNRRTVAGNVESTRSAAERAAKRVRPYVVLQAGDALHKCLDAFSSGTAAPLIIATAHCEEIPEDFRVYVPADAIEAGKAIVSAGLRPAVIAVTETPVPACTALSDVLEIGMPNLYREGQDGAIVTSGPALHVALEVADEAARNGLSLTVIHLPTLSPLCRAELHRLLPFHVPVVFASPHPLAHAVLESLRSEVPGSRIAEATASALTRALAEALPERAGSVGKTRFAERMSRLGTENAFEVLAVINRLRGEGRDIVSFAIGEPDFPSPSNVKRAGCKAIMEDKTHYGESAGLRELREAIAAHIRKTRGVDAGPENVVVTPGAKPILFNTIMTLVDPGDEVMYPNPGFPIYESLIDFVGAKGVPVPLWESLDFNFDPEEFRRLVTNKTRLVILNTPQNPTGGILTRDALQVVAEMAQERDFWVLSDEVYSEMAYDGEFLSIASLPGMAERTVILDGFSKTYSMTGWRLGYGVMPADVARQEARIETNLNSCTATFTQWAGLEALTGPQDESLAMIAEFKRRRALIVDGLNRIPGFSCRKPAGAFYAFPNVTEACRILNMSDSKALQEYLLFEAGVAVLPRTSFGRRNAAEKDEYVRFSYATSAPLIEEGLQRIRKAMEG